MAKTYLDILTKRGTNLFLSEENLESLRKPDPRVEHAVLDQAVPVLRSPKQHQIEAGKNSSLVVDMYQYGASEAELVRAVRHGMMVLDADKHHLDQKRLAEEHGLLEFYQRYRRFYRKPGLTKREKLVITTYTGHILEGTAGKVVDFVEEVLGHSIQTPEPPEVPAILEVHNALRGEFYEVCQKHHLPDSIQGGYGRESKARPV